MVELRPPTKILSPSTHELEKLFEDRVYTDIKLR